MLLKHNINSICYLFEMVKDIAITSYDFYVVSQIFNTMSYIIDFAEFYFKPFFNEIDFATNGFEFVLQLFQHLRLIEVVFK